MKEKEDILGQIAALLPENDAVLPSFLRVATPVVENKVVDDAPGKKRRPPTSSGQSHPDHGTS